MILPIVYWPDPILKQKCEAVPEVTDAVRWFISEMEETMQDARGAGLAAPQVGRPLRIVTVCENGTNTPVSIVNPVLVELSAEKKLMREGCLSLPGFYEQVLRSTSVRVTGLDKQGQPVDTTATGLKAQALQHEIEHLDGIVFTDHLSQLKRSVGLKKVKRELERLYAMAATEYEDDMSR